jgi:hypothetical protein
VGEADAARASPRPRILLPPRTGSAACDADGTYAAAGASSQLEARQREAIREIVCDMLIAAVSTPKPPCVGDAHG